MLNQAMAYKRPPTGGGDGMEPWQASVEKRLDKLESGLTDVQVGVATLTERVAHLPSKGFIVTGFVTTLVLIAALVAFAEKIQGLAS
jgi:hypothetical protein